MMRYDLALLPSFQAATQEYGEAQKLIHAFPAHPGGYRRSADALMKLSRAQEAIGQYEMALGRGPGDIHALLGLAEAYDAVGLRSNAKQVLERLLAIAPDRPEALEFLARLRRAGF